MATDDQRAAARAIFKAVERADRMARAGEIPDGAARLARKYNAWRVLEESGTATEKQTRKLRMIERRFARVETMKRHMLAKADGLTLVRRPVRRDE